MIENKPECKDKSKSGGPCPFCVGEPFTGHAEGPTKIIHPKLDQEILDRHDSLVVNGAVLIAGGAERIESFRASANLAAMMGDHHGYEWYNLVADVLAALMAKELNGLTIAETNARYKGAKLWLARELDRQRAEAAASGGNVDNCPGCGKPHKHGEKHDGADFPDSL